MTAWYLFGKLSPLERHHAVFKLYAAKVRPGEMATLVRWREDARKRIKV